MKRKYLVGVFSIIVIIAIFLAMYHGIPETPKKNSIMLIMGIFLLIALFIMILIIVSQKYYGNKLKDFSIKHGFLFKEEDKLGNLLKSSVENLDLNDKGLHIICNNSSNGWKYFEFVSSFYDSGAGDMSYRLYRYIISRNDHNLPPCLVEMRGLIESSDVRFQNHPKFSKYYFVKGKDIKEVFNDELITYFEKWGISQFTITPQFIFMKEECLGGFSRFNNFIRRFEEILSILKKL